MKHLAAALFAVLLSDLTAHAAPLESPCTQTSPSSVRCDPVNTTNPLPTAIYSNGSAAQVSLDGALSVNTPASPQFADTFSAALDTTTNWNTKNSTGTAAVSAGQLVINSSTTASAWGGVSSQQTFTPVGVGSQAFGVLASFTVLAQANSVRVFGVFTVPATPTTAVPVTDGYIYRLDGTGALFAEIWSSGVAVSSTNVTTACLPAAGIPGIFAIVYRASLVQFTCGSALVVNQAPILGINPVNQVLPVSALSIAGSTPPAASAVMNLSALALAATSPATVKSLGMAPTVNDPALVVTSPPYGAGVTPIAGNAAGTTGAVVGTLTSAAGQTAYICGFNVQAIGGTAPVGPITIAGLVGSSQVYQGSASAAGGTVASQIFQPCIPASAVNTNITITTTADGTATAVNVNSWGFRQ
jgi:hypothetical protein